MKNLFPYDPVEYNEAHSSLRIVDQTLFPLAEEFLELRDAEEIAEAIRSLKVRGAPAIGVAAAYGLYLSLLNLSCKSGFDLAKEFVRVKRIIGSARPTAVNLSFALDRMQRRFEAVWAGGDGEGSEKVLDALRDEADAIKYEDIRMCEAIAGHGVKLLHKGVRVLTHCNAGHFATSRYGTALSPIYLAQSMGMEPKVYADETRPLLQGARITMKELGMAGVDATLICDNMAASLMKAGMIDAVMVGCDRIAANGDVANKIGTLSVAIAAGYFGIPFYVLGPTSTIDSGISCGEEIVIEQRDPSEVTDYWYGSRMAPSGIKVCNPAFDVTPASLVSAIVTENGISRYPYNFKNS